MCWTASTRSWRPARPSTPPTAPSTTRRWSQRRGDVRSERRVHVNVLKGPSCPYSPKCVEGVFSEVRLQDPAYLWSYKHQKRPIDQVRCLLGNTRCSSAE